MTCDGLEAELRTVVGEDHVHIGDAIGERYRVDVSRKYQSRPVALVKPASTDEVAAIVRLASRRGLSITVVGGQSGTVGSAVPADGGIALSLERMSRVVEIDPLSMTMTVEAGCILQLAQEAAEVRGAFLPLDLGARGSATIGGVIGTNAGGNRVIRWGMMRDMVIGLEVVLADGTIVSSLTKMLKDNAGYNWKHLLIGSEGTLGIVTRAVLRLRPIPTSRQTALIATERFEDAIIAMRRLEVALSGKLSSFELMWSDFYAAMTEAQSSQRPAPMAPGHGFYALVEAMGGDAVADNEQFERVLMSLIEEGLVADAIIAQSDRERENIWAVREDMTPGLTPLRPFCAYDVSMGIADMPAFVAAARAGLAKVYPDASVLFYGHAGDGNLHAIVSRGSMDTDIQRGFDTAIFDAVRDVGGSIAAEHGIGVSRAPYLSWTRSPAEIDLMRTLKGALDPNRVLNPGKLLDAM
ncbi:putative FAD-linked oxidoreductase [Brevundimonas sp. NIBR10]|uniref:FAD-binding oxidoreductase n=1 Tax=Brevundimonas sp. NIBR10 TaxID=3015997 RepID=UPI0022F18AB7|nr:FAD-binding oxidoreductase [Brevundimonas sp. NIBR10]WGM47463.1 putative FAD-linked oxidoreductase [Brevundimonas sp. NIBR10]